MNQKRTTRSLKRILDLLIVCYILWAFNMETLAQVLLMLSTGWFIGTTAFIFLGSKIEQE